MVQVTLEDAQRRHGETDEIGYKADDFDSPLEEFKEDGSQEETERTEVGRG